MNKIVKKSLYVVFALIVMVLFKINTLQVYASTPSFEKEEIELYEGDSDYVTISDYSSNCSYKIDNGTIAKYQQKNYYMLYITGLKPGETKIRIYDSNNTECDVLKVIVKETTAVFKKSNIEIDIANYSKSLKVNFEINGNYKVIGIRSLDSSIANAEHFYASIEYVYIYGYSTGTTKIQLYNINTGKVLSELTVKVIKTISYISFGGSSTSEMYVGQTLKRDLLQDLSTISDVPIWTSSDSSVASVSNDGVVTGKKKGICVISVSVGRFAHASYGLIVKKIGIQNKTYKIQRCGEQIIEYEGVSGKVKWKIANSKIAKIKKKGNKCIVTGKKVGKTKLTAIYKGKKQVVTIKITKPKYDFLTYVVSPGSSTKYTDDVTVKFKNLSTRPITIHREIGVVSDSALMSGIASRKKNYKIDPGETVELTYKSTGVLKLNSRTAIKIYFKFENKWYSCVYSAYNTNYGTQEFKQ